jgi:DNA-binding NarL/FixJ family response regulator
MMNIKRTVVIADDHKIFREGIIRIINEIENYQVIGEAAHGAELMNFLALAQPDIILLDIEMPVMNGAETLEQIIRLYPQQKVIMLSMYYSPLLVCYFFMKGARGYLPKNCSPDDLYGSIEFVLKDGYYMDSILSRKLLREIITGKKTRSMIEEIKLSNKEVQILKMILNEKTNKEISSELEVTIHAVDYYRRNILQKTNQNTIVGLVKYAMSHGLGHIS